MGCARGGLCGSSVLFVVRGLYPCSPLHAAAPGSPMRQHPPPPSSASAHNMHAAAQSAGCMETAVWIDRCMCRVCACGTVADTRMAGCAQACAWCSPRSLPGRACSWQGRRCCAAGRRTGQGKDTRLTALHPGVVHKRAPCSSLVSCEAAVQRNVKRPSMCCEER